MSQPSQPPSEQVPGHDRNKYQSPPPPPSSMTPPPSSSQAVVYPTARTPTPTHSHLSSPPPTVKRSLAGRKRTAAALETDSIGHSSDQDTDSANPETLRSMLSTAQDEGQAARTSAAHYRLQYELLTMESSEEIKRMGVELEMAQREVDVLQNNKLDSPISMNSPPMQAAIEWKSRCYVLEIENENLRYRLADAKAALLEREDRNGELIEQLRERIRENRKHVTQLKLTGTILNDPSPPIYAHTPRQHEAYTSTPRTRSNEPFAQLLLADQLLSQGAASTPATPLGPRSRHHATNQQSLTSLPSTPYRSAPRVQGPYYLNPPLQTPEMRSPRLHVQSQQHRRRESRDSTISASEEDAAAAAEEHRIPDSQESVGSEDEGDIDIPASSASQEAANMLRKSASFQQSQRQANKMHVTGLGLKQSAKDLMQSKMYGYQITKAGVPGQAESIKRRFYDEGPGGERERERDAAARPRKRGRSPVDVRGDGVGLGLGIGGWK